MLTVESIIVPQLMALTIFLSNYQMDSFVFLIRPKIKILFILRVFLMIMSLLNLK